MPIDKVVKLVSYEKTITAQLLRIANSPLYGRTKPAESIQAAIFTLGIQRIEDILLSNCFSKMVPHDKWVVDPGVFWRHSFGCALVCREFAERIGYNDPDKAYLAGLLHDIGIIVNSLAFTDYASDRSRRPAVRSTNRKKTRSASPTARAASSSRKPGLYRKTFATSSNGTTPPRSLPPAIR